MIPSGFTAEQLKEMQFVLREVRHAMTEESLTDANRVIVAKTLLSRPLVEEFYGQLCVEVEKLKS